MLGCRGHLLPREHCEVLELQKWVRTLAWIGPSMPLGQGQAFHFLEP